MQRLKVLYIDIEGGFGGSSRSLLNMVADLDRSRDLKFSVIVGFMDIFREGHI